MAELVYAQHLKCCSQKECGFESHLAHQTIYSARPPAPELSINSMVKKINYKILPPFLFFIFFIPQTAFAYLDAGSGSYVVQVLIAILAGSLFVIKIFFRQIRNFFGRIFSRGKKNKNE